jgi:hypothetical protein
MGKARRETLRAQVARARPARTAAAHVSGGTPAARVAGIGGGSALPGRGAAPAGAPGAPGAPAGASPLPWDSRANTDAAGALRSRDDTFASLDANFEAKERGYGLSPGFQNSPYSQALMLQRRHDIERKGAITGAGRRLYAGSTVGHLRGADFSYDRDLTGLKEQEAIDRANYERDRNAAQHQYETDSEDAQSGAIERREETEPDSSAAPAKKKIKRKGQNGGNKKGKRK